MAAKRVLITGGGGFVGSHLADELLAHGYEVRLLDNFTPQVHGQNGQRPAYLPADAEIVAGDVRDAKTVRLALDGVSAVYHFAAAVGVGQSMYEIVNYTNINADGTAVLLEALAQRPLERLVVASSMSIYGEGLYRRADGTLREGRERSLAQLPPPPPAPRRAPPPTTPARRSRPSALPRPSIRACLRCTRSPNTTRNGSA